MGTIVFHRRQDRHTELDVDWISDWAPHAEAVSSFQVGDMIRLTLEIDAERAAGLIGQAPPGINIDKKIPTEAETATRYQAGMLFQVTGREHFVSRDWMSNGDGRGFRLVISTVYVQAQTDAAEALFIELQQEHRNRGKPGTGEN